MSVRDWLHGVVDAVFGGAPPRPRGRKDARRFAAIQAGRHASYPPSDFATLTRLGWEKNEIAFMGISKVATAVAGARLRVVDEGGNEVEGHPTAELFAVGAPSLGLTGFQLWELLEHYRFVGGNMIVQKIRSQSGHVVELWPMRPDRTAIIPGTKRLVEAYTYRVAGKSFRIPTEDVLHWREPHLANDYWGMSRLRHAFRAIAADNEATDLRMLFLQNKAVPGVALISSERIDEPAAERARERYYSQIGGDERGGLVVLDETADLKQISFNMDEMAMPDLTQVGEARILGVIGCPPIVAGAYVGLKFGTYANYDAARRSMCEDTAEPEQERIRAKLQVDEDLGPERPGDRLEWDRSKVAALASARRENVEVAREDYKAKVITRDEARAVQGLPPAPDGEGGFAVDPSPITIEDRRGGVGDAQVDEDPKARQRRAAAVAAAILAGVPAPLWTKVAAAPNAIDEVLGGALGPMRRKASAELRRAARKYYDEAAADVRQELPRLADETKDIVAGETKQLDPVVQAALDALAAEWEDRAVEDLWPLIAPLVDEAGKLAAVELGVEFALDNADTIDFVRTYRVKFSASVAEGAADDVRRLLLRQQEESLTNEQLRKALEDTFDGWDSHRSNMVARTESQRAANMGAKAAYRQAGVTELVWEAGADPCEFCANLDGRVVGVDEAFVEEGGEVESAETPGKTFTNSYAPIEVPPLHPHCMCSIIARRIV